MRKKKLTKASIDEFAKGMPVLNETEQRNVVGGSSEEWDCVIQSIPYMSSQLGCSLSIEQVRNITHDYIMQRYNCDEDNTLAFMKFGILSSDIQNLCNQVFSGSLMSGNAYEGGTFSGNVIGIGYCGHTMIFTDCVFDDCGNVIGYSYYDPQAANYGSDNTSGFISINDVNFIYSASGCI
jgi:hypothetical protein